MLLVFHFMLFFHPNVNRKCRVHTLSMLTSCFRDGLWDQRWSLDEFALMFDVLLIMLEYKCSFGFPWVSFIQTWFCILWMRQAAEVLRTVLLPLLCFHWDSDHYVPHYVRLICLVHVTSVIQQYASFCGYNSFFFALRVRVKIHWTLIVIHQNMAYKNGGVGARWLDCL